MSKQDMDALKESKGQFTSMNSILSTSIDRQLSLLFLSHEHDDLRSSYEVKPFSNVSSQSQFTNE